MIIVTSQDQLIPAGTPTEDSITTGVLDLTNAQYHKSPGISKSDLDLINVSPAHYLAKGKRKRDFSPALQFGTLFHSMILEPASCLFHVKPEGMNFAKVDGKAWKADHLDLPIITQDDYASLMGMQEAVKNNADSSPLIHCDGVAEQSLFYRDDGGFIRKCRPDWIPANRKCIVDLKSTECARADQFTKSILNFRYHVQAAWYLRIAQGIGMDVESFIFVAVEKEPPYAVAVYELDEELLDYGRKEATRNWSAYVHAKTSGEWPSYGSGIKKIKLPEYLKR
jgi:hypothetical protein